MTLYSHEQVNNCGTPPSKQCKSTPRPPRFELSRIAGLLNVPLPSNLSTPGYLFEFQAHKVTHGFRLNDHVRVLTVVFDSETVSTTREILKKEHLFEDCAAISFQFMFSLIVSEVYPTQCIKRSTLPRVVAFDW